MIVIRAMFCMTLIVLTVMFAMLSSMLYLHSFSLHFSFTLATQPVLATLYTSAMPYSPEYPQSFEKQPLRLNAKSSSLPTN